MTGAVEPRARSRPIGLLIVLALAVLAPLLLGKGGLLLSAILVTALLGAPLFVLLGVVTVTCFLLWTDAMLLAPGPEQAGAVVGNRLVERIRGLADSPQLLAVPFFITSGAIMARGQISVRLVEFARALVGWFPGGMACAAVIACMLFAAISGSSPATVVAIGSMMGPTLIASRYGERFTHGLLTAAGSLGILIPPSIPMVIYPLVMTSAVIEVKELFNAGFGPGFVIGGLLAVYCVLRGLRDRTPREPFRLGRLRDAVRDGLWSLGFPVLVLGGINSGLFNVVGASAVSVVYAVAVEVLVHRALSLRDLPRILQETGVFLGSLLVIMVAALAFTEFLEGEQIPRTVVDWITGMQLEPWQFLLVVNLVLLVVGMFMDILSAMFVFVPLLGPIAVAMGIDPVHFGIIFIVNLEIGYLTPPVGLNLFVASTLFGRPLGHIVRSVLPFIGILAVGLGLVTWLPALSVGFGRWITGEERRAPATAPLAPAPGAGTGQSGAPATGGGVQTLEEMMREAEGAGVQTLEEMMREAEAAAAEEAPAAADAGIASPDAAGQGAAGGDSR
ncbi:MAG: TRAP transporter large permease subunit [Myxococcota bacterium]|nr:TRAP transporter large permease subunit [Myxococcota bacterium]MDW8363452.1 TRAP transporter large permease subunit [Myxococcales bacterium]